MRKMFKNAAFYIFVFLLILMIARQVIPTTETEIVNLTLTELVSSIEEGKVKTINLVENNSVQGTLQDDAVFYSYIPSVLSEDVGKYLFDAMTKAGLEVTGTAPAQEPWILSLLPMIFGVLILVVLWFVFMQNSQGGGNKVMSFGKSRAKMIKEDNSKRITFADVAGLKEEKEELYEVVDFLKNPKKYIELGARIPKGILLIGPPGTGKTYLSRAIAGEAGVPFFSISGSDFVEMFVGVGASRVRDLFENAKKNSPCIIFIDEIDAVGRKRGAGLGGGHDEREQTLNQLLVEMDGFSENEGIILMAATNRPDILDPALLRPGRFDREITVGRPDVREREEIIRVHARNKPVADDVDFKTLAKATPGFTPADIENLLNEAAILTARKSERKIRMRTIEEATTKVIAGVEKKSRVISEKERRLTAYHEAGHAILAAIIPEMDPVQQITIIPHGRAGGFTMQLPQEDRNYMTKRHMENELIVLLGGRVAERLILHDISTGAQNDLSRVSDIARAMVTKYAMSENLGSMSYGSEEEVFLGRDMTTRRNFSEQVAADIDREVRRLVDDAYDEAMRILSENIDKLHQVANALLEYETINGEEFSIALESGFEALREKKEHEEKQLEADRLKDIAIYEAEQNRLKAAREEAQKPADQEQANSKPKSEAESEQQTSETAQAVTTEKTEDEQH
ncbi:ATP-dependent zinc metalloprotease FtsH [Acidaminobacter sp.]|uniref:ATP-dependent zinc metalloprotease FtsH n=1 Tax=Acidaminobacter sp. TaxID=1872102 RepID=UPI0013844A16|nr:ATP-dependent zinc metalloprotease FtsH [Acidaminobacter sp.]MDK9712167.1 ATP-dependent zinc metalloprotease FtsH [Acidaminobacter sp.]MZQ96182.1 ATP-dependent zinc metalloprotease FtsH [Acidaminobacter sp.]